MTVRKISRPLPNPRPTPPATRMLESSVSSWYARWKAAKDAPAPVESAPTAAEQHDEQAEAVARWLVGSSRGS